MIDNDVSLAPTARFELFIFGVVAETDLDLALVHRSDGVGVRKQHVAEHEHVVHALAPPGVEKDAARVLLPVPRRHVFGRVIIDNRLAVDAGEAFRAEDFGLAALNVNDAIGADLDGDLARSIEKNARASQLDAFA